MELDPQAQALLDRAAQSGIPTYDTMEPDVARMYYEKACGIGAGDELELFAVEDMTIPGPASALPARLYRPSDTPDLPILVFFHGGGFTIGSPTSHDAVCRHLCKLTGCLVVSVDYRLGPEHKFPAAAEDAYGATKWLAENAGSIGGDPSRIAVGGDSAGGNLSAVTCLTARDKGAPNICYQLLIYPGTDMTESFPSHQSCGKGYFLTNELIHWFHDHYMPEGADLMDWRASPLHAADHSNLPPAHIITAGFDPLQDEGIAFGKKLEAGGVPVTYRHYDGLMHGFITQLAFFPQSEEALAEGAGKLRQAFGLD